MHSDAVRALVPVSIGRYVLGIYSRMYKFAVWATELQDIHNSDSIYTRCLVHSIYYE